MRYTIVLALALAACSPAAPLTHDVSGTFTLTSTDGVLQQAAAHCEGKGGFGDITAATQITVKNQANEIIGTTNLGIGDKGARDAECIFSFSLKGLPDATFYSFESGHRGAVTFSNAEMKANGWKVALTLGG